MIDTKHLNMTSPQRKVYEFIDEFSKMNGWPPTHGEIAKALGFAHPSGAQYFVNRMKVAGILSGGRGARQTVVNPAYRAATIESGEV